MEDLWPQHYTYFQTLGCGVNSHTAQKNDQIPRKLRILSHLLKKFLMENSIFCAVLCSHYHYWIYRIINYKYYIFIDKQLWGKGSATAKSYFVRKKIETQEIECPALNQYLNENRVTSFIVSFIVFLCKMSYCNFYHYYFKIDVSFTTSKMFSSRSCVETIMVAGWHTNVYNCFLVSVCNKNMTQVYAMTRLMTEICKKIKN